jgi:hypothetical protein
MSINPLGKATTEATESRSGWTLQEHCEHANAQLILKNVNEDRRKKGLGPVHWIIRDGRVSIEWANRSTSTA